MKAIINAAITMTIIGTLSIPPPLAQEPDNSTVGMIVKESGSIRSLEKRLKQLEEATGQQGGRSKWYDRLHVSGMIEVETGYEEIDYKDPATADETGSDVNLAAIELVVDAEVADHLGGHVMLKYEEDEIFVDEGFITLTGTESFPAYVIAGRQYIPFGHYDSHFISDPATLILGETNTGAVVGGYRFNSEMVDISLGTFNGRVKRVGEDDTLGNVLGAIVIRPTEDITFGASYTSNLAASDGLSEMVADMDGDGEWDNISSFVGGWSAFFTANVMERFKVITEYVAALDEFGAGELFSAADTEKRQPTAWSVELGFAINDTWEVAARYGGSHDGGDGSEEFLPESQYGTVINWRIFDGANLAIEYLHGNFQEDVQEADVLTAQFAVEF